MAVTFDPATETDVVLSNGNLTVTSKGFISPFPGDQGAKVANLSGQTSGKYYIEMTYNADPSDDSGIGVGTTTAAYSQLDQDGTGGVILNPARGRIFSQGSFTYSVGGLSPTDVVGIAIDLANYQIWFNIPGGPDLNTQWNGDPAGDPVANVNGQAIPVGTIVPLVVFNGLSLGVAGEQWTANFGDSAFVGTVPSGFTAGWGAPTANPVAPAGGDEWPKRRKWLKTLNRVQLDEVADLVRYGITDVEDILDRVGAKKRRKKKKVPSTSVKQAKTMSAIAHGWHPTGKAAGIPVSVAKEFHAADAGKKYGKAKPEHLAKAMRGKW